MPTRSTSSLRRLFHRWSRAALVLAFLAVSLGTVGAAAADSTGRKSPVAKKTILVMGDSLSAGYGIAPSEGWVSLLAERVKKDGVRVVNASISGETTAGGVARMAQALEHAKPTHVLIQLGANDGLRGLPVDAMRANLSKMIDLAKARGAKVLLAGIRIPPNYGADYADAFFATYPTLAKEKSVELLPFLLEPIALDDAAYQPDRLHPTAAVQPKLLDHVWTKLGPML